MEDGEVERISARVAGMPMERLKGIVPMPCECKRPIHVVCLYRWLATGSNATAMTCPYCARTLQHEDDKRWFLRLFDNIDVVSKLLFVKDIGTNPYEKSSGRWGTFLRLQRRLSVLLWEPVTVFLLLSYALRDCALPSFLWWIAVLFGTPLLLALCYGYSGFVGALIAGVATTQIHLMIQWFSTVKLQHGEHPMFGAILKRQNTLDAFIAGSAIPFSAAYSGHVRVGAAAFAAWICTRLSLPLVVCMLVVAATEFAVPLLFVLAAPGAAAAEMAWKVAKAASMRNRLTGWHPVPDVAATRPRSASPARRKSK